MDAPNKSAETTRPDDYGSEVMCASWNPVASAVAEPLGQACSAGDASGVDVEGFLRQFYRFQGS